MAELTRERIEESKAESCRCNADDQVGFCDSCVAHDMALRSLERDEDAERYRWLRGNGLLPIRYYKIAKELPNGGWTLSEISMVGPKILGFGETPEAAINAARRSET